LIGVGAIVIALLGGCSSGSVHRVKGTTTTASSTVPSSRSAFEDAMVSLAAATYGSVKAAVARSVPGSAAYAFFDHELLELRAYALVGARGRPYDVMPTSGDSIRLCAIYDAATHCNRFSDPVLSTDGKLRGFSLDGVPAERIVRHQAGASSALAPQVAVTLLSSLRRPNSDLSLVLTIRDDAGKPFAMPVATAFRYRNAASPRALAVAGWTVPRDAFLGAPTLVVVSFEGANLGGTLEITEGAHVVRIPVPGPPAPPFAVASKSA
jgi:hypothetical protein